MNENFDKQLCDYQILTLKFLSKSIQVVKSEKNDLIFCEKQINIHTFSGQLRTLLSSSLNTYY